MGRKDKPIKQNNQPLPIGAQMRTERQKKGVSLTEMADLVNYALSHLSAVENGHDRPSKELLRKYEQKLHLESGQLSEKSAHSKKGIADFDS